MDQQVLDALPQQLADYLAVRDDIFDIYIDVHREVTIRIADGIQSIPYIVTQEDIDAILPKLKGHPSRRRFTLGETLHRVSVLVGGSGVISSLTIRLAKDKSMDIPVQEFVAPGASTLLIGRPGTGKTTTLREIAGYLSDVCHKSVMIVDKSGEITGWGDKPFPLVGRARRMVVFDKVGYAQTIIEAVENHAPDFIIVDEISTQEEAEAVRTAGERGINVIATCHGSHIGNVIANPILADLLGGVNVVTVGDSTAAERGTSKTVRERKFIPSFDIVIEMLPGFNAWVRYDDVQGTVDAVLNADPFDYKEIYKLPNGKVHTQIGKYD